nr:tetratricopeptide repeat protein [Roseibium sp. RKSG952]
MRWGARVRSGVYSAVQCIILGLAVLYLTISSASAQTGVPVAVEAAAQPGYGRMILTFKDRTLLPNYDAVITGGVLRISFEEPIDINVDDVPLYLGDYISIARSDPDGSAIRFALKERFRINTLEAGEKLFVDLLPSTWQGHPPGLPDDVVRDLAQRAEEALRRARSLEQARLKAQEGPAVSLRVGQHPTFTRLVFDWSILFDSAFVREDDLIRVTFNHPAQLDVSELKARLPDGVVDATAFLDEGKLKFLMRVEPSVDIRAFREDRTYVIDITPNRPGNATDSVNALIDSRLSGTMNDSWEDVVVATGVRPGDGPAEIRRVDGHQAGSQGAASGTEADTAVAFDGVPPAQDTPPAPRTQREAPATAAASAADNQAAVPGAVSSAATDVPPTSRLASNIPRRKPILPSQAEGGSSRSGTPLAVPPPDTSEQRPPAASQAALQPEPKLQVGSPPAVPEAVGGEPVSPPADVAENQPRPVPAPASAAADEVASAAIGGQTRSYSRGADRDVPPPMDLNVDSATSDVWRANGGRNHADAGSPEQPPENAGDEARAFVAAEARRIGNTVRVVFPFSEPVASAVFRRDSSIWLVFDTDATIDVRALASALSDTAEEVSVRQYDGYQTLRMDMVDPVLATAGIDGNAWSLVIGDLIIEPSIPLKLERNVLGDGEAALRVLFKQPHAIRQIEDPFVGDTITLVTGFGPPRGLLKTQSFVDLDALSSAHGIAIAPRSDGVSLAIVGDDVLIQRDGGLFLSNRNLRTGSSVFNNVIDPNGPGHVEFVALSTNGPGSYRDRLHSLQDRLSAAPEGDRREILMEMSRFYLAHQFAPEALGLMKLAVEEDPALAENSSFNLMMGAAQAMANRPEEAHPYLNRPDLKNSPDAAIWQTIVDTALGNWTSARISMPRGRAVIGNYPAPIQAEFNLAAAQAMIESNDFGVASGILAEIEPSSVSAAQAARYDILRGRVADASGRSREALTVFDMVMKSDDRPRAAEAEYRALQIRYRDGDLGIDEAIHRLSGLATSWRGDEIELKTLRFLARLQAEKGNYREAFEAMKSALQADADADTTRLLQEEMKALFATLYLDGKVDVLSPIKALALYYDFRELTPVGRQGDEMVRVLAKRLVEVDLLDQAAELLRHQVDNRLKGAARAQIAADLAAIYLMDRKQEEALRVLSITRQSNLPSTLERQRNIVEARALTASGRPDLALELVRNMRGADVDRLRADTFWAAQSWREAGEELEAMHGSRWSDHIALAPQEREDILRAAIAYSLAGDQLSLDRLRTKYMQKMSDSEHALAFEVVTRPIETQGVEFLEVANALANTDTLETFMDEYRRQYMTPASDTGQVAAANGNAES